MSLRLSAAYFDARSSRRLLRTITRQSSGCSGDAIPSMDDIISLCKRRGFIFPSSEIYNSVAGFYDFGHLGVELKNNIKSVWWRDMVHRRDDVVGLDSSIISSSSIWKASGHVDSFSDPLVDCKESKLRFRADHVVWGAVETKDDGRHVGYICFVSGGKSKEECAEEATKAARRLAKKQGIAGPLRTPVLHDLTAVPPDILPLLPSPSTGTVGVLTPPRDFNLMFSTSVGAVADGQDSSYLRPETAQGIFTNFLNIQRAARMKVPFGVAQIGKAFRNEITPRNFIFRSREFEQMEIEYFIPPEEEAWKMHHEAWLEECWQWILRLGLRPSLLSRREHSTQGLAHYSKACTDIEFRFPFGVQELMGVSARGSFDLDSHSQHSGKSLEYTHTEASDSGNITRKFIPHTIEPSFGLDRLFLATLVSAYREDSVGGEKRVVLSLHPAIAPIKVSIMPLVKNNAAVVDKAQELYKLLRHRGTFNCEWDSTGAIGRRYRRADEIGTPFCVTVDFDSLEDNCVTLRHRDSTLQERIPIDEVYHTVSEMIQW